MDNKQPTVFYLLMTFAVLSACGGPLKGITANAEEKDKVRKILSLDGTWEILFDTENVGRSAAWHRNEVFTQQKMKRNITVPGCWEGIEKDYEGVAYYRRKFFVPENWQAKIVRINFDAVNFISEVWVNDHASGYHEGGFTPFMLRVDKLLNPGEENTLIIRVAGPVLMSNKTIDGIGKMETPQWRGAITGGIWQPVRLIATDKIYVKDILLEPKIADNTVTFHMEFVNAGEKTIPAQIEIKVRDSDKVAANMSKIRNFKPGSSNQRWTLNIPDAAYWSPDDPHLYNAEVSIVYDDKVSDRWASRFGIREFTVRDKQFYLNGEPMYLKATFFEGLYPVKLAYPDSREMAAREISLAKEAGFNMIRPWRKPPPKMWLDLCDEMGVLTVGSMAIECMDFPFESARLPGWVENEVCQSILRDRNRTCVVQWELFNELKRPVLKQLLHSMSMLARELDPTRLILDESGGWAQGANLYLPYESEPTKFNDIHYYPGPFVNEEVYNKLLLTGSKTHEQMREMGLSGRLPGRNVITGLMTFFSELGYGSLPDLVENNNRFEQIGNPITPPFVYHHRLVDEHEKVLKESGFDRVYPDLQHFCLDQQRIHGNANKQMIEAVRCNPAVKGYCVHALVAGDWIMGAGLLDLWRNPKTYAYEGTKAANQPRIIAVRMFPRNVYARQGSRIEITGVNELEAVKGILKVRIVSEDDRTVYTKEIDVDMVSGITPLFKEKLDTKKFSGTYTLKAEITACDGTQIAGNEYSFDVFTAEQLAVPKNRIAVFDPGNSLEPFLKRSGIEYVPFDSRTDRSLVVFVSRTEAKTQEQREIFDSLKEFITDGGTVVYLQGGGLEAPWAKAGNASKLLPVRVRIKASVGLWLCISHIVSNHPVFDGLPVDCMMGPVYENVWAQHTLLDVGVKPIAGSVGFDFAPDFELDARHYYGPGDTWWGGDLSVILLGKGQCVLSQLRLVDNLGKDPVADKILFNLIEWTD